MNQKDASTAMVRYKRNQAAKRLKRWLSEVDDEACTQLIWGVDALQSEHPKTRAAASSAISYKPEHAVTTLSERYFIHKWSLETLINELLTSPKLPIRPGLNYRRNTASFENIIPPFQLLHELEDAQFGVVPNRRNIFDELARISHRQFEWQRGHVNIADMYRSAFLFGGERSASHFETSYGLSIPQFVLAGFASFVRFQQSPVLSPGYDLLALGIDRVLFAKAHELLTLPIERARAEARKLRSGSSSPIAYQPSILRRYPCVSFDKGNRIRAPLSTLVLARATTGIYYDLVGAGGGITREIGERFEDYCFDFLRATFPEAEWHRSRPYTFNGAKDTPDIRMFGPKGCELVVECKAKRMTIAARFGEDPLNKAPQGFAEVSKGVWQIWRYFSHLRRGAIPGEVADPSAIGLVLTLDPWLQMSRHRYDALMRLAEDLADADRDIEPEDRRPVAFCAIEDFERLMMKASLHSFLATIRAAASTEYAGWHVSGLHDQLHPGENAERHYIFRERVASVLPWWTEQGVRAASGGLGELSKRN